MTTRKEVETITGLSIKALLFTMIGILLFGIYVGILIFGENSLTVLNKLREKKEIMENKSTLLKHENQSLQKVYFEFKQAKMKNDEE